MVGWSVGRMVHMSGGPVVGWSSGRMVHMSGGPEVGCRGYRHHFPLVKLKIN